MNQTIYFRKDIWDKFQKEENKSDIINKLLGEYYNTTQEFPKVQVKLESPIIKTPKQATEAVKNLPDKLRGANECKNGHLIPEGRTKCLQKGCKYAK